MNRSFTTLRGIAAPIRQANIDTDKILAGQYLKTISRAGLGDKLFAAMRYSADGSENEVFVLNRVPWRNAQIIVALENFGCGSSREHAPWALLDFGIRCVIAPSFADIFYSNCFKNGILPITLPRDAVEALLDDASDPTSAELLIDLPHQSVGRSNGETFEFEITAERKSALLEGRDEIAASLLKARDIDNWEARRTVLSPPIPQHLG